MSPDSRLCHKPTRVLLVAPRLPADDPRFLGDHAYTDLLLAYPPAGVEYRHYLDELAAGRLRRHRLLTHLSWRLKRAGYLPPDTWAEYLIAPQAYDLVHILGYSAVVRRPGATSAPVVHGQSTGSDSDLRFYLGWPETSARRARRRKRCFLRLVDAYDSSLRPERTARIHVWSHFARRLHLDEGHVRPDSIEVLYPGLPIGSKTRPVHAKSSLTFGFVGGDFERKGGDVLLDAFGRVRTAHPQARLLLVGRPANGQRIHAPGVEHHLFLSRDRLLREVYPEIDVLVLPSRAEGFGLVLLEAMSYGIPVVAVNAWAMSEVVTDGENGWLITAPSVGELTVVLRRILERPEDLPSMTAAVRDRFARQFSVDSHRQRLGEIYGHALD